MNARAFLWIALLLVAIWIAARVIGFMAGAMLNLLWIAAIIFAVIWLIGQFTGRGRTRV
ncbi:hypothetical protein BH20GEM3_BH20GEM3_10940 [soil metagenome]|jgi:hypothetical protein|nr:hypothetical protein [Gemmatimonadota bacterium]